MQAALRHKPPPHPVHFPTARLHRKDSRGHAMHPPQPETPEDCSEVPPLDADCVDVHSQSLDSRHDAYIPRDPLVIFLGGRPNEEVMFENRSVEESKGGGTSPRSEKEEMQVQTPLLKRKETEVKLGKAQKKLKTAHRKKHRAKAHYSPHEARIECSCELGNLENSTNALMEQIVYTAKHNPEFVEHKLGMLEEQGFQAARRKEVVEELVESTVFAALPKHFRAVVADSDFDIAALVKLPDDTQLENENLGKADQLDIGLKKKADVSDIDILLKSHVEHIKSSINEFRSAGKILYESAKAFDDFIRGSVMPNVNPIEVAQYFKRMKDMPKEKCSTDSSHSKSEDSESHSAVGKLWINAIEVRPVKRTRPSLYN